MVIDVVFWLLMAVTSVILIELRANYRINYVVDARIKQLRLQPYHKPQQQAFGTKH